MEHVARLLSRPFNGPHRRRAKFGSRPHRMRWSRHARSRHCFNCPLADRARDEGVAGRHAARRPGRADGARRAGQGARPEPPPDRRPDPGLRSAGRRSGLQPGPRGRRRARLRLPARHHRQPLLLVVAADHPDGVPRDQGRRGRRVHLGGCRDGVAIRQRQLRLVAGHQEPAVRRGAGAFRRPRPPAPTSGTTPAATGICPTSTSRWARPQRTSRC